MSNYGKGKLGNAVQRAEARAKAYEMSLRGESNVAIGKELGVSRETVRTLLKEYIDALTVPLAEEMRKAEDDKLNKREALLWRTLAGRYKTVSHGKVVIDTATGEPVSDLEPLFKADAALNRIAERRAALWGLNTPVKTEHVVTTTTPFDIAWADLIEQQRAMNAEEVENLAD
ncbi:helix-turn-helix domain-containing protein [Streptomyces sp. NPDC055013]